MKERQSVGEPVQIKETEIVPQFSNEDTEKLIKSGFQIYTLSGKSFGELAPQIWKDKWEYWLYKDLLSSSIKSEIAIPIEQNKMFLKKSFNKTFGEQKRMVSQYSTQFKREFNTKSMSATIGNVTDYLELILLYRKRNNKEPFRFKDFYHKLTRTTTSKDGQKIIIGQSGFSNCAIYCGYKGRQEEVGVLPLIIPTK